MRRHIPWWLLALLFIGLPLLEIFLLIQLGQVIGAWWTILVLVLTGVLGSYLMKREGSRAWKALREALASHRMPGAELADGALILIGGTLLLTPGFVSDAAGLFCILPFTRPVARGALTRLVTRRLIGTYPGSQGPPTARRPGHSEVIRGEVVDDQ